MEETWRAVPGYEGRYEVSSFGRVRSLRLRNGHSDAVRPTPLLIGNLTPRGYWSCRLSGRKGRFVHDLVLEAFVGPRPPGMEAAHLNGRGTDNRPENLAWKTHVENEADKVAHGSLLMGDQHPARLRPERMARGERNAAAKLNADQVLTIRAEAGAGSMHQALARRFGVSQKTVQNIVRGVTWAHLGDKPFPERPAEERTVISTPIRRKR